MKILMNDGWSAGKLIVREEFVNSAQVALIELMYVSVGKEFDAALLRNPDWRFVYSWNLEEKSLWAAQAYDLLRVNSSLRRKLLNIPTNNQRDLHLFLYSFGNKYGLRQSRDLRHVDAARLVRIGHKLIADARRSDSGSGFFERFSSWFKRVGGVR